MNQRINEMKENKEPFYCIQKDPDWKCDMQCDYCLKIDSIPDPSATEEKRNEGVYEINDVLQKFFTDMEGSDKKYNILILTGWLHIHDYKFIQPSSLSPYVNRLSEIVGKWPGDESAEEIIAASGDNTGCNG